MKAVVDTNVVAYFLLGTQPFATEARRFLETVTGPSAPALWEAEIGNVVWMSTRAKVMSAEAGAARLRLAMRLGIQSVPMQALLQGAYLRAVTSGVAVYDAVFVELAARESCPLATFDRAILKAFPDVAVRPRTLCPA